MKPKSKVLFIIRDGWGYNKNHKGNAVYHANTPNHDNYVKNYPTTVLACTGNAVGNPEGVQGGSEVGHGTMGAGRIVWQPYELINQEIKNGSFFQNEELLKVINHCKKEKTNLHINGLFSNMGVHADYKHMFTLLDLCQKENFHDVYIHLTLDGRDMPEKSALPLIKETEKKLKSLGFGQIVSMIGRYYSMDRDKNWDRTRKAYDLMTRGEGFKAKSAQEGLKKAYDRGEKSDYYVKPTIIVDKNEKPLILVKNNDGFIWYNFRSDRARQITAMINNLDYCGDKPSNPVKTHYVCFANYNSNWKVPVAFPQQKITNILAEVVSKNNLTQLRIAETEKYAHVTFFFNSQIEDPFEGETRMMIPSPKVDSYDKKPEMSAYEVTEKLLPEIGKYDFIVINYANPDLVGHSGVFEAAKKACEVVDECVGKVVKKALEENYTVLLGADHGNADHMLYDNGEPDPSHGFSPILLSIISNDEKLKKAELPKGKGLQDIAPTVLKLLGLEKPKEMTGESLI